MTDSNWSAPDTAVFAAIADGIANQRAVLATIVAVDGSAYRRPGAKMVITDDNDSVGSITAGCLEDEVSALAESVLADGEPRIEQFDLTSTDDVWGLGIGCNGVVDILLDPLDEGYQPVVDAHENNDDIAVLTVLDGTGTDMEQGDRTFAYPTGSQELVFETAGWPDQLLAAVAEPTQALIAADSSDSITSSWDGKTVELFVDTVRTPPELVVFGSGHDVGPVVELAKRVGFSVTVVTFRGAATDTDQFDAAERVVSTSPANLRETLSFDVDTYAVVMSHNFVDDRLALDELLATSVEYIGLVGSRQRFEEMQDAFAAEGRTFRSAERNRIYTPAGLDLGGGTPFHIAQSIVAEVTAVHYDRDPQHLTERKGPIHPRSPVDNSATDSNPT